ncbi:hypothetical protein [Frankia sp. AgB32]|uniref:hypothetical protein n=1 Tax=Frankia sp. AgB32 TaxID=631119 RepID=UPI00200BD50A|nr:hypothetical protein [Frankia sp. AgB32]MCK9898132.1 hypothetical protein [Frankia sp. AgB32]
MMLLAAGIALLVRWVQARRVLAAVPVEVVRDICPACGHTEDHEDAGVVASWMAVHRAADHTRQIKELR